MSKYFNAWACVNIIYYQILFIPMNGLQITGMKMSSPVPVKKTTSAFPKKIQETPKTVKKVQTKKPVAQKSAVKKPAPKVEKKVEKKVQEVPPKVEVKEEKAEELIPQPVEEKHEEKIIEPEIPDYEVTLRYNHYKDKFMCEKGILSFKAPNQKYCFGLVFLGNYQPKIRHFKTRDIIEPHTTGTASQFCWKVEEGETYQIQIDQDEQEESKREKHVYRAPEQPKKCPLKKNIRVDQLTDDMKKMGITELGSEKHRELLQQRDLEDILYS